MTNKAYAGRKGPWFASRDLSRGPIRSYSIHDKVRGSLLIAIVANHPNEVDAHAALLRTDPQLLELLQEITGTTDGFYTVAMPSEMRERAAAIINRALDIEVR